MYINKQKNTRNVTMKLDISPWIEDPCKKTWKKPGFTNLLN